MIPDFHNHDRHSRADEATHVWRLMALAVAAAFSQACSLTVAPPTPTPAPPDMTEVAVGEITRLNAPPPTRTPVGERAVIPADGLGPTPLPGLDGVSDPAAATRAAANIRTTGCAAAPAGWTTHSIREGDYISVLAGRYNTTVEVIMDANCLRDPRRIELGQVLVVPPGDRFIDALPTEDATGGVDLPVNGGSSRVLSAPASVDIYFTIPQHDGRVGSIEASCGAGLVPVTVTVFGADTAANRVRAALEAVLSPTVALPDDAVEHPLGRSDLAVEGVSIDAGVARVALRGTLEYDGYCDAPLVRGQIEQTVLDDDAVNSVIVMLNGAPLDEAFVLP